MKAIVHPVAGALAMLCIAGFWLSTVLGELFGSQATVVAIKSAIPCWFLVLIPALMVTGASGFARTGNRGGLIAKKIKRMPWVAANGILILIPCALFLAHKANAGELDGAFYLIQGLELIAGAANFTLLGLNMRDGLRMKGRA